MTTISQQLNQLQADKQALVEYLVENEVDVANDETFTSLIPKLKVIKKETLYAPIYISFYMFEGTDLGDSLSRLDTCNMTSFRYLFKECKKILSIDLSNKNTNNVTDMFGMFYSCELVQNINISGFNTNNVTNMGSMFFHCYDLKSIDLSSYDTTNVTNMANMFNYCEDLTTLDLSNFYTSNVNNMTSMFYMCVMLKQLDIRNFDFTNVSSYSNMFGAVPNDCEIIVRDDTAKAWITEKFTTLTNVKTVAELEVSL